MLDQDKLTRISLLLGTFNALNMLYSRELADGWVNLANSNPMFEGETPIAYMIKGGAPALMPIRQLLDARRVSNVREGQVVTIAFRDGQSPPVASRD